MRFRYPIQTFILLWIFMLLESRKYIVFQKKKVESTQTKKIQILHNRTEHNGLDTEPFCFLVCSLFRPS